MPPRKQNTFTLSLSFTLTSVAGTTVNENVNESVNVKVGGPMRHIRAALARFLESSPASARMMNCAKSYNPISTWKTAENIRRGMPPDEARRQALLASGGLTQAAEAVRDQRGLPWLESIAADLKYALRALRHSPAFTAVVVITLMLGIGANTAIFSVVRGVLLKPLPHREGDRLLYLRHSIDGPGGSNINFSVPEVRDFRNGVRSLAGVAEYSDWTLTLEREHEAVRIDVGLVTGNYFEVMGLAPVLGRVTRPSDDGRGVPPVMVLTHEGWLKRFAGDSSIVGKQVTLNKQVVTVIGVLQPAPFFPGRAEALLNMVISEHHLGTYMLESRAHRMTEMVARLAPGASVERARAEVEAVYAHMQVDFREAYDPRSHYRVAVLPFKEVLGERARLTLWLLMGVAAFVMIIAAANVANLTLMRGVRREQELVVRAALGAGVTRLRRLLLVENLVLALLGAVVGVFIATGGVRLLTSLADRLSPRANEIRLDGVALGFALGLSVTVAVLLSFLASLPREGSFASRIMAGAHRMTGSLRRQRLQRGLVVVQIAVSVVLLAGAGLLTRTMLRLADVDTGLATEEVLTMQVSLLSSCGAPLHPRPSRWPGTATTACATKSRRFPVSSLWEAAYLCSVTRLFIPVSGPKAGRSPRARRCRAPRFDRLITITSAQPGFRCSRVARSPRPIGPIPGRSRSSTGCSPTGCSPVRDPHRKAHRLERPRAARAVRRLVHDRRRGRQYPGWRAGCRAARRGVPALDDGRTILDRRGRWAGDSRPEQRVRPGRRQRRTLSAPSHPSCRSTTC